MFRRGRWKVQAVSIIRVRDLTKEYRRPKRQSGLIGGIRTLFTREYTVTRALDGISFSVDEGEVLGYIGPNGAGKSTTVKILTGILVPSAGEASVNGIVPWQHRETNARSIGIVFGQRSQLWWDLPLIESFKLIARMYRVPDAQYRRNLDRFVELLDMSSFLETPVRQLSLGQRMRGDLVAAMLYEPRILYLDEPTVGLDVLAKERIRTFIQELLAGGRTTILLTTHDLSDVERLCKRVLLIDKGRLLYDGSIERLKAQYAPYRVLVVHRESAGDGADFTVPGAETVQSEGLKIWLRFDPEQVTAPALISAVTARMPIADLAFEEPDLEGVVRQIYEQQAALP